MPRSLWMLVVSVLVACGLILGLRSCDGAERGRGAVGDDAQSSPSSRDASTAPAALAKDASDRAHAAATRAAVSTLYAYIGALPGQDRTRADAFWVGGKPPVATGEADLRALRSPKGMRLQNWTPTFIDSTRNAVEIPVALRVHLADASIRRYRGWYRLRRATAGDRWEIISASIDAESRPE